MQDTYESRLARGSGRRHAGICGANGRWKPLCGSLASKLEKFDPATGNHQAVVDAENWVWGTPSLEGDTLYFGDVDGNFYSYNTSTGATRMEPIKPITRTTAMSITASPLPPFGRRYSGCHRIRFYLSGRRWKQSLGKEQHRRQDLHKPHRCRRFDLVAPLETDVYLYAYNQAGRAWTFTPEN